MTVKAKAPRVYVEFEELTEDDNALLTPEERAQYDYGASTAALAKRITRAIWSTWSGVQIQVKVVERPSDLKVNFYDVDGDRDETEEEYLFSIIENIYGEGEFWIKKGEAMTTETHVTDIERATATILAQSDPDNPELVAYVQHLTSDPGYQDYPPEALFRTLLDRRVRQDGTHEQRFADRINAPKDRAIYRLASNLAHYRRFPPVEGDRETVIRFGAEPVAVVTGSLAAEVALYVKRLYDLVWLTGEEAAQ